LSAINKCMEKRKPTPAFCCVKRDMIFNNPSGCRSISMHKPAYITRAEIRARRERFQLLARLLREIPPPIRILDVGGTIGFWTMLDEKQLESFHVTLLNLFPQENLPPNFCSRIGDARCMESYGPGEFDVVLSNSVIGHVGAFEDQKRMAGEIRRIGQRYFVQTPNSYFPLDWRTLIPFFHFLPLQCRAYLLHRLPITPFGRLSPYSRALEWAASVRNLTYRELCSLFPEAIIGRERVLGFTKSFMVLFGFSLSTPRPYENRNTTSRVSFRRRFRTPDVLGQSSNSTAEPEKRKL
jgi:hypothetical protein